MTIYARSDLAHVYVSEGHGGHGVGHSRPVENGAPAKIWALTCDAGCEDFLRHDDHWSPTLSELPETYDEGKAREDFTKRGAADRDQVMALAMAKLAGVELPDTLRFALTGHMKDSPAAALMECPDGHPGKPGFKFCAECGETMQQPVGALPAPSVTCPAGHLNAAAAKFCHECGTSMAPDVPDAREPARDAPNIPEGAVVIQEPNIPDGAVIAQPPAKKTRLRDMKLDDLQSLAAAKGIDASGTRVDLIGRLKGAPDLVPA